MESPQSTDRVEQSSADTDDSGVEAEKPSGPNGQGSMTGQEIDQPVSSTLPSESTAATSFSLSDVEPYSGSAYVAVNGNIPYFTSSELTTTSFELYSALDSLSRCGTAYACIGQDLMPTEERGSIGSVKPSGWHTVRYNGVVDGNYLYNRCHLIGFQLSGENANERNLITGTRYLNIDGMLPFENMVADYVQETNSHVLYRVTPVFEGDNLLAAGVLMEGYSVEDDGDGICFCIFAYNVQPGVTINYATGDSTLPEYFSQLLALPVQTDLAVHIQIQSALGRMNGFTQILPLLHQKHDEGRHLVGVPGILAGRSLLHHSV